MARRSRFRLAAGEARSADFGHQSEKTRLFRASGEIELGRLPANQERERGSDRQPGEGSVAVFTYGGNASGPGTFAVDGLPSGQYTATRVTIPGETIPNGNGSGFSVSLSWINVNLPFAITDHDVGGLKLVPQPPLALQLAVKRHVSDGERGNAVARWTGGSVRLSSAGRTIGCDCGGSQRYLLAYRNAWRVLGTARGSGKVCGDGDSIWRRELSPSSLIPMRRRCPRFIADYCAERSARFRWRDYLLMAIRNLSPRMLYSRRSFCPPVSTSGRCAW